MLIQLLHHPDLCPCCFQRWSDFICVLAAVATFFELEGTAFFVTITGFVTLQLSKVSIVNSRRIFLAWINY
jgi:hypothetical protein